MTDLDIWDGLLAKKVSLLNEMGNLQTEMSKVLGRLVLAHLKNGDWDVRPLGQNSVLTIQPSDDVSKAMFSRMFDEISSRESGWFYASFGEACFQGRAHEGEFTLWVHTTQPDYFRTAVVLVSLGVSFDSRSIFKGEKIDIGGYEVQVTQPKM